MFVLWKKYLKETGVIIKYDRGKTGLVIMIAIWKCFKG